MQNPTITVLVIAYNSGNTILETLESIKNQTYRDIEIVISDDNSTDNTIILCTKWLEENKKRFINAKFITVSNNTGTTANINRALKSSTGEWIKSIAADDILLPNCIKDCVAYAQEHSEIEWFASKMKHYYGTFDEENYIPYDRYYEENKHYYLLSAREQYLEEIKNNFIGSPSLFFKRDLIVSMGYYDEKYILLEDIPMHLSLMKAGHKCYFLDKYTVCYRKRDNTSPKLFSIQLAEDDKKMTEDFKFAFFSEKQKKKYLMHYKLKLAFQRLGLNNRHNPVCRFLFSRLNNIIDIIYK